MAHVHGLILICQCFSVLFQCALFGVTIVFAVVLSCASCHVKCFPSKKSALFPKFPHC